MIVNIVLTTSKIQRKNLKELEFLKLILNIKKFEVLENFSIES